MNSSKIYVFLFMLVLISCSTDSIGKSVAKESTMEIRPGEARFLQVEKPSFLSKNTKLICRDAEFKYYTNGNYLEAYVVESYFSDMSPFKCILKDGDKEVVATQVKVEQKKFPEEKLKVDSRKVTLRAKDQARVAKEQVILNKIYASSESAPLFKTSFMSPLKSYITSIYGIKRTYNRVKKSQHLGTDFRAGIGEKIPAANRGKVVLSADLFFTGWTVIIDHGLDIFTVYGHLSKTLVESGQIVQKGDLIGLSGSTGRSSGPHLHWGVKIHGQYIDGIDLVEQTKKQFKE